MQPISYGVNQAYAQSYPILPNCFDNLTTNGIVAEDVMGYITGQPSLYLQNYVAQRGWPPHGQFVPGQILPDALPTLPNPTPLPRGKVYPSFKPEKDSLIVNKGKYDKARQIALSILLTGLAVLGVVKGRKLISKPITRSMDKTDLLYREKLIEISGPKTNNPILSLKSWYKAFRDNLQYEKNIDNIYKNFNNKTNIVERFVNKIFHS